MKILRQFFVLASGSLKCVHSDKTFSIRMETLLFPRRNPSKSLSTFNFLVCFSSIFQQNQNKQKKFSFFGSFQGENRESSEQISEE
jgi:hypothetical protein